MKYRTLIVAALIMLAPSSATADDAHDVADRLAHDLVCMCGECNRLTLAVCTCAKAAKERDWLLQEVSTGDLSTPRVRDSAYRRVHDAYLARVKYVGGYGPTIPTRWVYFGFLGAMVVGGAVLLFLPRKRVRHRVRRGR